MRSPVGGTSSGDLSMTMGKQPGHGKQKLAWKLYRDQAGQIQFRRVREKSGQKTGPVVMEVTIPKKVTGDEERLRRLMDSVTGNGGNIVSARARMMSVVADVESAGEVGDVLDSFGCQWDIL